MSARSKRFDLYPGKLMGHSAYGSAEMLGWLVYKHSIERHVTVFDKSARTDGTFSREDFTYDHAGDIYTCPGGKMLNRNTGERWRDDALPGEQARLRKLRLKGPLLPKGLGP